MLVNAPYLVNPSSHFYPVKENDDLHAWNYYESLKPLQIQVILAVERMYLEFYLQDIANPYAMLAYNGSSTTFSVSYRNPCSHQLPLQQTDPSWKDITFWLGQRIYTFSVPRLVWCICPTAQAMDCTSCIFLSALLTKSTYYHLNNFFVNPQLLAFDLLTHYSILCLNIDLLAWPFS